MNLVKEEIVDTYVIHEKPVGAGIALGDDAEEKYEMYLDGESAKIVYVFNNELPYFLGDAEVVLVKNNGEIIKTQETEVIVFADYPVFLLENESLTNKIKELRW